MGQKSPCYISFSFYHPYSNFPNITCYAYSMGWLTKFQWQEASVIDRSEKYHCFIFVLHFLKAAEITTQRVVGFLNSFKTALMIIWQVGKLTYVASSNTVGSSATLNTHSVLPFYGGYFCLFFASLLLRTCNDKNDFKNVCSALRIPSSEHSFAMFVCDALEPAILWRVSAKYHMVFCHPIT